MRKYSKISRIKFILIFFISWYSHQLVAQNETLVLKGGTIIDVTGYGKSEKDLTNTIVIIEQGKIKLVNNKLSTTIPKGAKVIDVTGKFIVPGLIDCFGIINNQAYANAYLYMGVTTAVVLENDNRRGKIDWTVDPSPLKLKLDGYWGADSRSIDIHGVPNAGYENINVWDDAKISHDIDSLAKEGVKVLLVHYGVVPKQLPAIVAACKRNNIATIGELGLTSYKEAVKAGIQSFVHTSRYSADILPDSVRKEYSISPFGPPGRYYYDYIVQHQNLLGDPKAIELSNLFGNHDVGLIPTASMIVYPEMDFARNPWLEPIASIINENDIEHEPIDKQTGRRKVPAPHRTKAAPKMLRLDQMFAKNGARFLAGSGTDAFGTIPGISLHTELEMFTHMGLTNRQVLAAATHNFSLLWNWTSIGKIEQGRKADILVLNNNPLESLENLKDIEVLILDGKVIDREKLLH